MFLLDVLRCTISSDAYVILYYVEARKKKRKERKSVCEREREREREREKC